MIEGAISIILLIVAIGKEDAVWFIASALFAIAGNLASKDKED